MTQRDLDSGDEGFPWGIFALGAFCGVAGFIFLCILLSDGKKPDSTDWKTAYQTQVCKSYGRVLNTDNHDRWCMDPVTKGIFEIKEKE
jgi:hypothetical protein